MNRNKKEIFQLLSFLIEIRTQHKRLNKKRIDVFNLSKQICRIESVKYCRSNRVKSSVKVLDDNRIVIKVKLSKYGYYKILIKTKEFNKDDVIFLDNALRYFFS